MCECVCVRAGVRAYGRTCVCACVCACVRVDHVYLPLHMAATTFGTIE